MRVIYLSSVLALTLALGACTPGNSARQTLGFDRKAPDAFSVSTHAPLAVPSNLQASLPVPRPGMARPQEVSAQLEAQAALLNAKPVQTTTLSAAEQALVNQAGTPDPNVRAEVNAQAAKDADAQHGLLDWVVFWRDTPKPGVTVDAAAEAARLKAARAAGQSALATATPVIEDSGRLGVPKEIK